MHPDQQALLQKIRANPDDDAPRLVYADWLEEHDREFHAEFIRLSIAVDRWMEIAPFNLTDKPDYRRMRTKVNRRNELNLQMCSLLTEAGQFGPHSITRSMLEVSISVIFH